MRWFSLVLGGVVLTFSNAALATDWVVDTKITDIEASFVPNEIVF